MLRRVASTTALCLVAAGIVSAGQQSLTRGEADSLQRKLATVLERGAKAGPAGRPVRTTVTDREVNAYLKFQGAEQLPVGVVNPTITILDVTRVAGTASVNLDAVRLAKVRAWSDPLAWVTGVLEIRVVAKVRASNGKGTLELETATLGGVPIPKLLLQEVVSYYSRTPESPSGFNLDQPFALPQRIRHVELQRGSAVIVQ
jgi:hypothetical protein